MKDYGTTVCTEVKKNMIIPEVCDERGRVTCTKEFLHSFEQEPQFFGPIGQGSELQQRMLRFRKQSELNFALESNLLDNVLHHKKLTVRGIRRVEIYLKMPDIFRLIIGMIHHTEEYFIPQCRSKIHCYNKKRLF